MKEDSEKSNEVKIVIATGEYYETYAPFPKDPKKAQEKVIRGILSSKGLEDEKIDRLIDHVVIEPAKGGADGRFDDGPYTPIQLALVVKKEIPPEEIKVEVEKHKIDLPPRKTMLQQFYGDRKEEKARKKIFARYKSHVVKKPMKIVDANREIKTIEAYTVEDYPEKDSDADKLLMQGYSMRLERLSRAHNGDFTCYERELAGLLNTALKEIMFKYEEMHILNPEAAEKFKKEATKEFEDFNSPEFRKKAVQALIDEDTEFIETNNHGYNSHQNTQENLKTLGKFGEKSEKHQISDDQSNIRKFGLQVLNKLIGIRNHTSVPVNKAIGTFVAAPIHRLIYRISGKKTSGPKEVDGYLIPPIEELLATSQKRTSGMFKNKISHRYAARKDYFAQQEKEEIQARLMKEEGNDENSVRRTSVGSLIRLAILPRIKAAIFYREGNVALLNAGLYDIERQVEEREDDISRKRMLIDSKEKHILKLYDDIDNLQDLIGITKDPETKEKLEKALEMKNARLAVARVELEERKRWEVDSIQTDPLSMSQHDKANKSNVTRVVKGVKTTARAAAGMFISKYLYREVINKIKLPDKRIIHPGRWKTEKREKIEYITKEIDGLDTKDVSKITLEDIYSKGEHELYEYVTGGNTVVDGTSEFRGLAFKMGGKLYSGSDGKGFDPTVLTGSKLDNPVNGDTTLVSTIQEILGDQGLNYTEKQIANMLINGEISGINLWRSSKDFGVPTGWMQGTEIVADIIKGGKHTVTEEVKKITYERIRIPGRVEIIPGEEVLQVSTELNPIAVAALAGLGTMEASDFNDLLRHTRSQESMQRRHPKLLLAMLKENEERLNPKKQDEKENDKDENENESKNKIPGTRKKDTKSPKVLRKVKPFQRNTKFIFRYYTYDGDKMREATTWERFTGKRNEDLKSPYNENAINVNSRFKETEKPYSEPKHEDEDEIIV